MEGDGGWLVNHVVKGTVAPRGYRLLAVVLIGLIVYIRRLLVLLVVEVYCLRLLRSLPRTLHSCRCLICDLLITGELHPSHLSRERRSSLLL
jgi:hypothetical protein